MPKFNVGDTLNVNGGSILKVKEVTATYYIVKWEKSGVIDKYTHSAIEDCCALVAAAKPDPPKAVVSTRWYNVYAGGVSESYPSRRDADEEADEDRIGCKKVVFMSGEYDD